MSRRSPATILVVAATAGAALLLGLFFGFVGAMKTFAPIAVLEQHHAWTTVLPAWLGRFVGISELACAAALLLGLVLPGRRGWIAGAAPILAVNQVAAAAVHLGRGETDALPQNAILLVLLAIAFAGARRWRQLRARATASA